MQKMFSQTWNGVSASERVSAWFQYAASLKGGGGVPPPSSVQAFFVTLNPCWKKMALFGFENVNKLLKFIEIHENIKF